jgi:uncharacterized protein (DUF3820 family)
VTPLRRGGWLAVVALVCLPACRSTYPEGSVKQTIEKICHQEYKVAVDVQTVGRTVGAFFASPDILQSDLTLSDQTLDKIEHVMLTVSRVTLSSAFQYDFFVITALEPKTGIQVSFVRYLKDVRRLLTDDISRTDFFQRMLIESQVSAPGAAYQLAERHLPDFLARQIAERSLQQLQLSVVAERLFQVQGVRGEFVPAEKHAGLGGFRLTLEFGPQAPVFATVGSAWLRENFLRLFLRTAQTVTRRYEYFGFDGLELVDVNQQRLAYYDRKQFTQDTVNALMDLIRSIKDKTK